MGLNVLRIGLWVGSRASQPWRRMLTSLVRLGAACFGKRLTESSMSWAGHWDAMLHQGKPHSTARHDCVPVEARGCTAQAEPRPTALSSSHASREELGTYLLTVLVVSQVPSAPIPLRLCLCNRSNRP